MQKDEKIMNRENEEKIMNEEKDQKMMNGEKDEKIMKGKKDEKMMKGKKDEKITNGEKDEKVMNGKKDEKMVKGKKDEKTMNNEKKIIPTKPKPEELPFYFKDGQVYPQPAKISKVTGRRDAKLLPFEDPDGDRWINQLMFVPPNYEEIRKSNKTKLIGFPFGVIGWMFPLVQKLNLETYISDIKCPVSTCTMSKKKEDMGKADLLFDVYKSLDIPRNPNQIYAFLKMEGPIHDSSPMIGNVSTI